MNEAEVRQKLRKVEALFARAGTGGEREAAAAAAEDAGSAFVAFAGRLEDILCIQQDRVVASGNTVRYGGGRGNEQVASTSPRLPRWVHRPLPRAGRRQPRWSARRLARGALPRGALPRANGTTPERRSSPRQGGEFYFADSGENCTAGDRGFFSPRTRYSLFRPKLEDPAHGIPYHRHWLVLSRRPHCHTRRLRTARRD